MRKVTHYIITGESSVKPEDLPEGFAVAERKVSVPVESLEIKTVVGDPVSIVESSTAEKGVGIVGIGLLYEPEVRKLRDFLNVVLGEDSVKLRAFKDTDGDSWFEFEPDKFTMGGFDEEYPKALVVAENRLKDFKESGYAGGFVNQSYEAISRSHGPLTEFKP